MHRNFSSNSNGRWYSRPNTQMPAPTNCKCTVGSGSQPPIFRFGVATVVLFAFLRSSLACPQTAPSPANQAIAVGPQYDATHVYVAPTDFEAFVNSFVATFGGSFSKRIVGNVLSVSSTTEMRYAHSALLLRTPNRGKHEKTRILTNLHGLISDDLHLCSVRVNHRCTNQGPELLNQIRK